MESPRVFQLATVLLSYNISVKLVASILDLGFLVQFPVRAKTLSFTTPSSVSDPEAHPESYPLYGSLGCKQKVS